MREFLSLSQPSSMFFDFLILILQVLVGGLLLVGGGSKFLRTADTANTIAALGFPSLSRAGSILLPAVEVVIGFELVSAAHALVAADASVLLFAVFTVVIVRALLTGKEVPCNCFGILSSSATMSWITALRSSMLAAIMAATLLKTPTYSRTDLFSFVTAYLAHNTLQLLCAVALLILSLQLGQSWFFFRNALPSGTKNARRDTSARIGIGNLTPNFICSTIRGARREWYDLLHSGRTLVVFTNSKCRACHTLRGSPQFREATSQLQVIFVNQGTPTEVLTFSGGPDAEIIQQQNVELAAAFGVRSTPSAVVMAADGVLVSHVVEGPSAILDLLAYNERAQPASQVGSQRTTLHAPSNISSRNVKAGG